jgi:hypothetical protein
LEPLPTTEHHYSAVLEVTHYYYYLTILTPATCTTISIGSISSILSLFVLPGAPVHKKKMTFGTARGREALSVSIAFTTLATVFTFIRIYTRTFLVKQMGADDWTIIVALVSLFAEVP